MNTKCYSVALHEFAKYTDKCFRARAIDGTLRLIPSKAHFGVDNERLNTYWVAEWFIRKACLPYNPQRCVWFDEDGNIVDDAIRHTMSREELESLYRGLERFVADLSIKEVLDHQSAIKEVQTILHKSILRNGK